jgi:DNA-binding transcriptional LysR family regulator
MAITLDIDLVRTFHTVVRTGKFSAAAQHLHKSPAAISTHVQRLEALAGGRLLERDNQAIALTALGKRLLATTAELLSTHDRVLAQLQGTRLAGRVTLGIPDEYAAHVIRDILPGFAAAWPNVVLEVKTAPSYVLEQWVRRGKLQMVLMSRPMGAEADDAQRVVATTPVWVAAAGAPANWPEPLPLAIYAADCPYRRAMLESLKHNGRRWRVVLDSPSSQAIRACVEAGLAVSVMDRAAVTAGMDILEGFPALAEHEVVLLRAPAAVDDEAIDLLARSIGQSFRL